VTRIKGSAGERRNRGSLLAGSWSDESHSPDVSVKETAKINNTAARKDWELIALRRLKKEDEKKRLIYHKVGQPMEEKGKRVVHLW